MKARLYSWTQEDEDEGEKEWIAYLTITMPDDQDIDFTITFATEADATQWCADFEEVLESVTVSLPDRDNLNWQYEIGFEQQKEIICQSINKRVKAFEKLVRQAYSHLPTALQGQADILLKPEEETVVESKSEVKMLAELNEYHS